MKALGELNFRDVGGLAAEGGTIRHGLLYRSEGPASFGDDHRSELAALGFKTVCDLRSGAERSEHPNDWSKTARLLDLDVIADIRAREHASGASVERKAMMAESARATMHDNYRAMPGALLPYLPTVVDLLAGGDTPLLVHCTAGKDRTGVLVALLLTMLGVSRNEVERDYLRSECFLRRPGAVDDLGRRIEAMTGSAPDRGTIEVLAGVDRGYLEATFEAIEAGWGTLDVYFEAAGIDSARRRALSNALVE